MPPILKETGAYLDQWIISGAETTAIRAFKKAVAVCRFSLLVELRESKLLCAVNRDKQVKFAFFSATTERGSPDYAVWSPQEALERHEQGPYLPRLALAWQGDGS
jgi:hypothetical protein